MNWAYCGARSGARSRSSSTSPSTRTRRRSSGPTSCATSTSSTRLSAPPMATGCGSTRRTGCASGSRRSRSTWAEAGRRPARRRRLTSRTQPAHSGGDAQDGSRGRPGRGRERGTWAGRVPARTRDEARGHPALRGGSARRVPAGRPASGSRADGPWGVSSVRQVTCRTIGPTPRRWTAAPESSAWRRWPRSARSPVRPPSTGPVGVGVGADCGLSDRARRVNLALGQEDAVPADWPGDDLESRRPAAEGLQQRRGDVRGADRCRRRCARRSTSRTARPCR